MVLSIGKILPAGIGRWSGLTGKPWRLVLCLLLAFLLSGGCAAGFHSSLVEVEGRLDSPMLSGRPASGRALPVVYPSGRAPGGQADSIESFGPAWRGLEPVYKDYSFNPFNP